jgi:oxygen-independent coproporphyrinogen-3 oxidase
MVQCILREIDLQSEFFPDNKSVSTIYFGGGTPSVLSSADIDSIYRKIRQVFVCAEDLEFCLEANPDDLKRSYLQELLDLGVNRLSIGVQSLNDETLKWMNRSHTVEDAVLSVKDAGDLGFKHINIDMIYGIPGLNSEEWTSNLLEVRDWPIDHLSAYSLTLEPGTPYDKLIRQGKYNPPNDELSVLQFGILRELFNTGAWEQYEISNFAKDASYSRHNSAYWTGEHYLGLGPAAHSFDGSHRYWNIADNKKYIDSLSIGILPGEQEFLSIDNQKNEQIMTGLRTKWGLDLKQFEEIDGTDLQSSRRRELTFSQELNYLIIEDHKILLTEEGMLYADQISADLFF